MLCCNLIQNKNMLIQPPPEDFRIFFSSEADSMNMEGRNIFIRGRMAPGKKNSGPPYFVHQELMSLLYHGSKVYMPLNTTVIFLLE